MPIEMGGNLDELKDRQRAIVVRDSSMDPLELRDREEAAEKYALENEKHFVDYVNDQVKTSVDAKKDLRGRQAECWDVYNEKEPLSFKNKAPWQSRIIVPRPFESVQYGAAAIKKAFSPDYLSVQDSKEPIASEFWRLIMNDQNAKKRGNFVLKYSDAVIMCLAIGESLEIIPRFVPGKGLEYTMAEPWKIHRDPDAPSRDPQGGMYWIHQEWLDWYVLLEGQKKGKYVNVEKSMDVGGEEPYNLFMTKEAIAERKNQIWERSTFRKYILTSEFWGVVLSPKGEMLLPSATYSIAGGRVIENPKSVPYKTMRWPGISFSALPNILAYGGRGLVEGVTTIWESMCTLMSLHDDSMKWVVDPPVEVEVTRLVDQADVEDWPGKKYQVRESTHGNPAIRPTKRQDVSNSVMANMAYRDQIYQRGSFVADAVQGLPGWRKDMTWRESAQNLDQAMGVFGLMGGNLEEGAVHAQHLAQETIEAYAGWADYLRMFPGEDGVLLMEQMGIRATVNSRTGVEGLPEMSGMFSVSGIQALMKDAETLMNLREVVIPLAQTPRFGPYIQPYGVIKAIESRINLTDEDVFVDEDTAKEIQSTEKERAQEMMEQQQAAQDFELIESLKRILNNEKNNEGPKAKSITDGRIQ